MYQPPSKTSIWNNSDGQVTEVAAAKEVVPEVAVPDDESDGEYQVISKKAKTAAEPADAAPTTHHEAAKTSTTEPSAETVNADEVMDDAPGILDAEQGPVSDADWLRSRTNRVLELVEDDEEIPSVSRPVVQVPTQAKADVRITPEVVEEQPQVAAPQPPDEQVEEAVPSEEDKIRETGRLYVRNLHFEVSEDELREQFSNHGDLEEVSIFIFLRFRHAMMNVKIGTTDAKAYEVDL